MKNRKRSKKRILVVCQHYWPESFRLNDICDYFIEEGYEVDVLCGIPNYPKGKFFDGYSYFHNRKQEHNGVNIRRVFEIPRGGNSNFGIFLNNISFSIASILHIPRLLTKHYDRIFIYQLSPVVMAFSGIVVGKIKKIETTMWVIDPWPESLFSFLPIKSKVMRKIAAIVSNWHYKHTDKLIVLSEIVRERLIEVTGKTKDKVIVLPMACEKVYEEQRHDKSLAKRFHKGKGLNILFAGTLTPILSFDTVLQAHSILISKGYKDINWIIIGDGMARKDIEAKIINKGYIDNFFFEGFKKVNEIPAYTTSVADVLFSSLIKSDFLESTIPSKIPSYLAAGKPILLSMNGAAPDLVTNVIGCGFSSPAENPGGLADNIEKIYNMTPRQRQMLGAKARTYHFKYFERGIVLKTLLKYIQE